MTDQRLLARITYDPDIFGGKPIIRGMRISVESILSLLAQGESAEAIHRRPSGARTRRYSGVPRLCPCSHRA